MGASTRCEAGALVIKPAAAMATKMTLANSGGWCGLFLSQANGDPFAAGLVKQMPAHGKIYVHTVGDRTRVDYTPDRFFHGSDSFAIKLLPGDGTLTVSVVVQPQ